jgi:hypothetical protein
MFTRKKSEMVNVVFEFIKKLKLNGPDRAKFIFMHNANENVALKTRSKKERRKIQAKFTSPNTPQQNCQVERSFATLWG